MPHLRPPLEFPKLKLREIFGLNPLPRRLTEAAMALRGDGLTPPSRFDLSSLTVLNPRLGVSTWLRRIRKDRRIPIYNLFNRTQTPLEEGWSVRRTQVRDFRGQTNTYDSHNGTDFAIPVGTVVVAPAAGRVLRVCNEFHRGGLKVFIDHGGNLMTTSNHLGRSLVRTGQRVERGQPIALSGGSGLDMVAAFPWSPPHVHFNVWLNGEPVDPFAAPDEIPLWHGGNDPVPFDRSVRADDDKAPPSSWDEARIEEGIAACLDAELRAKLTDVVDPEVRGADLLFHQNYFPTRFERRPSPYAERAPRQAMLDLPFRAIDFVGIVHLDSG